MLAELEVNNVSKILDQPVTVNLNAQGLLAGFTMGGNAHKVIDVLEEWRDIGCWWDNEGEKVFYRVHTTKGGYELYHDLSNNTWHLYRIID